MLAGPSFAQEIRPTVPSAGGDRLTEKPAVRFVDQASGAPGTSAGFRIDDAVREQTMEGFGAAFNEAGLIALDTSAGTCGPAPCASASPRSSPRPAGDRCLAFQGADGGDHHGALALIERSGAHPAAVDVPPSTDVACASIDTAIAW